LIPLVRTSTHSTPLLSSGEAKKELSTEIECVHLGFAPPMIGTIWACSQSGKF
jgi:hypothetical protein